MSTKGFKFVSLYRPPKEVIKAILPHLTIKPSSLLSFFGQKYAKNPSQYDFWTTFVFQESRIIGWGIVSENLDKEDISSYYKSIFDNKRLLLMLYIHPKFRKNKLGSKLVSRLLSSSGSRVSVIEHDDRSFNFFHKMKKRFGAQINIVDWRSNS